MAKRNSMSTARRSRNRKRVFQPQSGTAAPTRTGGGAEPKTSPEGNRAGFAEILTAERARLMKAEAVLECVAFALLYEDWLEEPDRPCFVDAVRVVRDLVRNAIEKLDIGHTLK
jgi:hypothetical protein